MNTTRFRPAGLRRLALAGCLAVLGLAAAGCDNFLAPKPTDVLTTENFYHSAEDAVAAVNAVYAQLPWTYFYYWYESDIASDDVLAANFGPDGHQLADYTFDASLWSLDNQWSNAYITINKANIVLDRVPSIVMDTVQRNRVLGEAHFLRALMYFDLVRMFGDVPVMLHEVKTVKEAQVPQVPADSVYALIENDLTAADRMLLPKSELAGADIGRATTGAAEALLAKVYLTEKKYDQAAAVAGKLIASGQYALNANWKDNFRVSQELNNPESIFEINYGSMDQNPWVGSVLLMFQLPSGFPGGDAWGTLEASPDLVQQYAQGDVRGDHGTVMESPYYVPELHDTVTWAMPDGAAFAKYYDPTNTVDRTARAWQQLPNNWIVLRYADVLLMYAEAVNEGGAPVAGAGTAEAALNAVRQRAGIAPVSGLSQGALRDSVRLERRREFAFEGQRWFDLSRWGILDSTFKAKTAFLMSYRPGEVTGVHGVPSNLFPIPQTELNNNPYLKQNPGW